MTMNELKIRKVIGAHDLEQYTKAGWSIEEAFFQDEPAVGDGSTTLAGTDQYGTQQWNIGEAPVVALSRRFYVVYRTEEVDLTEKIVVQQTHIEELREKNTELLESIEKAQKEIAEKNELSKVLRDELNRFRTESDTSKCALDRIKQALGQERFDELVGDK